MMRLRRRAMFALPLAFVAAVLIPLSAQNADKRPIGLGDILSFRAMTTTLLSPNGQWFAYRVAPLVGDSEVTVRHTATGQEHTFKTGEGSGAIAFSDDSQWLSIMTSLTRAEAEVARRARRPIQTSALIVNLATGDQVSIPKVRRASFAGEMGGWVALHRYGPDAPAAGAAAAP
ncbi:MAG: hypothetical protein O2917_06660, partial [Acidobacteria bacterium]|nr:hypothetical protein [Acidobacteriota bacterium]